MSIKMGYDITSSCDKPRRSIIFMNSFKPILALIITFYVVINSTSLQQGFYDLIDESNTNSKIGTWVALAFWLSIIIWPSLCSTYFSIQEYSCSYKTQIKIKNLDEIQS